MNDLAETILTGILTGLAANAVWESGKWAWKYREEIARRFSRISEDIAVGLQPATLHTEGRHITAVVNDQISVTDQATTRVTKDADLRWNVEASTRWLPKRLTDEGIELLSWYLRVS
jgi:hypothetical protein